MGERTSSALPSPPYKKDRCHSERIPQSGRIEESHGVVLMQMSRHPDLKYLYNLLTNYQKFDARKVLFILVFLKAEFILEILQIQFFD